MANIFDINESHVENPTAGALWTAKEVAAYLNVKESTIRHWLHIGFIPRIKFRGAVRFRKADIDAWLSRCASGSQLDVSAYASRILKNTK